MAASKIICLFDVDGTLTKARQKIEPDVNDFLQSFRGKKNIPLALVGGSDLSKIVEQTGKDLADILQKYDYVFSENGVVAYKHGQMIRKESIHTHIGEEKLQTFINHCLSYLSTIKLPVKRGNFVEFRNGMINISPIGRSCSQAERDQFDAFDKEHGIRQKMVENLQQNFPINEYNLQFSIGGQISIDVFPVGWDKTHCLSYLTNDGFSEIHFFGDRINPGGNDHEIYEDSRTIGHGVKSPNDTVRILTELFPQGS